MPEIGALSDKKLNEAIYITAKIAIINFIYEKNDEEEKDLKNQKKFNFINFKIKKLNKEILPLIFIEIIKLCIEKETKQKKKKMKKKMKMLIQKIMIKIYLMMMVIIQILKI